MPKLQKLLPNLKRVDQTPLDANDQWTLRLFYDQFRNESDEKLHLEREEMRARLKKAPTVIKRGPEGTQTHRQTSWPYPHLDEAKREILTAIIQGRQKKGQSLWARVPEWIKIAAAICAILGFLLLAYRQFA